MWWLGRIIAVWVTLSVASAIAFAGQPGSIRGTVRLQGKGIANHRIMLIRFAPGQTVQRTPGQTDTEGRFTFEHLETDDGSEYVVGIRYAGRLYRSPSVRLQSGQDLTDLVVEVQQVTAQPGGTEPDRLTLYIANHLKVVVLKDDHLAVREIIRLVKSRQETGDTDRFSLFLPLPQGYDDVTALQGLDATHVRLEPAGLFYTAPLAAGEHRIVFSYNMPFRHKVITMLTERALPTVALDVLVQETQLVASSNLRFEGRVSFESHTFSHFHATDLLPQNRSWLQITRQSAALPFLRVGAYSVILVIALLGIGGAWVGKQKGSEPSETQVTSPSMDAQTLDAARSRLLDEIARLDDAYESGTVNLATYQHQRRASKQQLIDLYQQLQAVSQNKGVLAEGRE